MNITILSLLLFIALWDSNPLSPGRRTSEIVFRPFLYFGLWHGWSMFAPEPIHIIRRLKAVLVYLDGSVEAWSPDSSRPETRLVNLLYARSFKYEHSMCTQRFPQLFLALCRFLQREVSTEERQLRSIELQVTSRRIRPYGAETVYSESSMKSVYQYSAESKTGQVVRHPVAGKAI